MNDNRDEKPLAVIYGEGSLYRECATQIHQLIGSFVPLIVDQKYFNTEDIFYNGIPCAGPEILPALSRSTLIVICTRNHLVIADDLRGMGFINIKYALFELSSVRVKKILDYPKNTSTFGSYEVSFGNRTVLITGSTRGIGLEIAVELALRGVRVILHGRTEGSLKEGLRRFEERTLSKTDGVVADLSQHDAPEIICSHLLHFLLMEIHLHCCIKRLPVYFYHPIDYK
jgi:FlaA1/EpsC-like NDP-sugar epimerase